MYFWHFRPFLVKKHNFWSKIGIYHKIWQRAGTSLLQCKYDEHNLQITEQYTETCKILAIFQIFGLKMPLFGKKFIFWDSPGAGVSSCPFSNVQCSPWFYHCTCQDASEKFGWQACIFIHFPESKMASKMAAILANSCFSRIAFTLTFKLACVWCHFKGN